MALLSHWLRRQAKVRRIVGPLMGLALTAAALSPSPVVAQYPNQPIRLVTGFAAGSATDVLARILAEPLAAALGQPFVVDNRPGAMSVIGTEVVARSRPDGYTLLLGANAGLAVGPAGLVRNVSYDPLRDFAPLGRVGIVSFVLVSGREVPANTSAGLIEYVRANQANVSCASSNANGRVFCEVLKRRLGVDLVSVYYGSGPQAATDLIAGRVSLMFMDAASAVARVATDQIRAYAVIGEARSAFLPDVPTATEARLPDLPNNIGWWGLFGPTGLPAPIADRLARELQGVLAHPEVRRQMLAAGVQPAHLPPAELAAFVGQDLQRWRALLADFNISPEG
ncbi:Bug family tripartite tricarboxylate transporter substrate binding protein [Siccirubricoccus phaeus]|uniref:Bug family tripartite tricarboxylate transporter substrate binding protein n=1 Tax=Siccirubricoccus phaeus TaxID=2595053 RepID=UPI0011F40600|nr:tripartite tricarboxylate transporter substrate binding protein [Siccirubricoccus phaeus]